MGKIETPASNGAIDPRNVRHYQGFPLDMPPMATPNAFRDSTPYPPNEYDKNTLSTYVWTWVAGMGSDWQPINLQGNALLVQGAARVYGQPFVGLTLDDVDIAFGDFPDNYIKYKVQHYEVTWDGNVNVELQFRPMYLSGFAFGRLWIRSVTGAYSQVVLNAFKNPITFSG